MTNSKTKNLLKKGIVLIVIYSIVLIFLSVVSCSADDDTPELPQITKQDTTLAIENTNKFRISKDTIIGNIYDTIDFTININQKSIVDTNIIYRIEETNKEYKAGKVPVNNLILGNLYTIKISKSNISYKFKVSDKNIVKCHKYLWFDATANFVRFSNKDSILYYVNKAKEVGFTDIVIDVKPCSGDVLYRSKYINYLSYWNGYTRNINFDYLKTFIDEGHRIGLKVHANLNTFSFGNKYVQAGMFYRGQNLEWMTINNTWRGLINGRDDTEESVEVFANPALPEVQALALNIINEVATKYPSLDGIVLDRGRYNGATSDFSLKSKELFEAYAGVKVQNFPADVFTATQDAKGKTQIGTAGKYMSKWFEWRASVIYNFFEKARNTVKSVNPNMKFGTYTGSWYWEYFGVGVNWASKRYNPQTDYGTQYYTNDYKNFGYAALLDIYMTGAYSSQLNSGEWGSWNVPDMCRIAKRITMGDCQVCGGLYVVDHKTDANLQKAVEVALAESDGLMIFDICHLIPTNRWNAIKQGIANAKK